MSRLPTGQENAGVNCFGPNASLSTVQSITASQVTARLDPYTSSGKRVISDVRRTFCLFVTFDLLFVGLLWIIELNVDGGIIRRLKTEVICYDFHSSYFDIFLLAVFRFLMLVFAYALCRLQHWWVIACGCQQNQRTLASRPCYQSVRAGSGSGKAEYRHVRSCDLFWLNQKPSVSPDEGSRPETSTAPLPTDAAWPAAFTSNFYVCCLYKKGWLIQRLQQPLPVPF
ncbi:STARD3 N-terminal-like protein isoform X3 [Mobula hypostoma]|uniref:STARD3 N-terminal-like protein isoform X3 n=1 Tax=Mobula hypostoma TaxID=723540 RepID=UPI002FC27522